MLNKILLVLGVLFIPVVLYAWTETYTFEDGTIGQICNGTTGFDGSGTTSTFSSTMAHTGTKSCRFVHPQGEDDWLEATGIIGIPTLTQGDEIWIRWYDYIVGPWTWTANPVIKVMRLATYHTGGEGAGWLSTFADGNPPGDIVLSNEPTDVQTNSGTAFLEGEWQCMEMYIKLHATPGQADFKIWQNGILAIEDTTHATLDTSSDYANTVYVWSYWNGNVPITQTDYFDDLIITNETPSKRDAAGNPMIGPSDWVSVPTATGCTLSGASMQ